MSKQSDESLGWLVLFGFMWWVWSAEDPPAWMEGIFWVLIVGAVLFVAIVVWQSEPVQRWRQRQKAERRREEERKRRQEAKRRRQERRRKERERERHRHRMLQIDGVDEMGGHEFERYVATMLEDRGFSVDRKGGSGDFGADAIAARDGTRYVVQAKRRSSGSSIGAKTIRATIGARSKHDCDRAMVVTNRYFTSSAEEQAGEVCELVDRGNLARWIEQNRQEAGPSAGAA